MIPKKYFLAYLAMSFMLYFVLFIWGLLHKQEADRNLEIATKNEQIALRQMNLYRQQKESAFHLKNALDSCRASNEALQIKK
jgi:hypothetical protein